MQVKVEKKAAKGELVVTLNGGTVIWSAPQRSLKTAADVTGLETTIRAALGAGAAGEGEGNVGGGGGGGGSSGGKKKGAKDEKQKKRDEFAALMAAAAACGIGSSTKKKKKAK